LARADIPQLSGKTTPPKPETVATVSSHSTCDKIVDLIDRQLAQRKSNAFLRISFFEDLFSSRNHVGESCTSPHDGAATATLWYIVLPWNRVPTSSRSIFQTSRELLLAHLPCAHGELSLTVVALIVAICRNFFVVTSTHACHTTYWPLITPRVFTARSHAVIWNLTFIVLYLQFSFSHMRSLGQCSSLNSWYSPGK
jgi:hypothetical protein